MMPERYFRYRTTRSLDVLANRPDAPPRVKGLGTVPAVRRWRRALRAGLFWTALGLGAATISYACDPNVAARSLGFDRTLTILFFALVPIPALALGVRGLALALRLRAAADIADRTAAYLSAHLPESYVVVSHYAPRAGGGDDDVPVVVIGPSGILVVEPREETGEIVCHQDTWYRTRACGIGRRLRGASVSQRARWNAGRVRRDIATGGFVRTPVEACVVFLGARLGDVASSCVPVYDGLDALAGHIEHEARLASSPARTRALADALVGPVRLAVV
jgi:nuclease-like protein